jgi:leader peptidase (prepilin peptidase) / N-methyltransferase
MPVELSTLNVIFGVFVFVFGISMGSFLNVVAYRIPLKMSLITPRSSCPNCKKQISNIALIPVLGFFFTKGKCSHCGNKISIQYPIIELFSGILTTIVFFKFLTPIIVLETLPNFLSIQTFQYGRFHFSNYVPFFVSLWIIYTGIPLSIIDLKYRILPDVIILPGIIIGFLISCLNPEMGWLESLLGILVGAGGLFFISKFYEILRKRQGMGMGDVKYLGFIGAVLGWKGVVFTLFYASIIGAIIGITWGISTKKGLSTAIPFGPFLAFGAFAVSTYGNELLYYIFGN